MKKIHLKKRYKFLFAFLVLICALLFAAPRVARWYIVKHSPQLIGRKLELEKIRINYFTGTLRIYGAKLYESDQNSVFVSFKLFKIHISYLPLFRNEIFIKDISLDDAFAEVLQDNDKFNFSDLAKPGKTTAVKDTVPSKPMKYIINNIKINRGYIKYTDIALNHTIALDRLDLLIPGFTWNSDSTNLDVNFRFVDGGGLYSSLALNQADSTYSVNLKLDSLNLSIIEPYVKSNLRITSMHGYLSNDIRIKGNMRSVMQLSVSGINHVFDFSMTDTLKRKILSFKDGTVDINSIQPDKNIVNLNSVSLTDPYIFVEMIDSTTNWLTLMKPSVKQTSDTVKPKTESVAAPSSGSYTFSRFSITGGKILYSDKTLRYPFEYTLDNVKIESTPVNNNPGKLAFNIAAGLNGSGFLEMKLTMNPVKYDDMDLTVSIGQFRMKDVDAYFRHYFGFPVTGGIMNFKTDNKIRPESLVSDNSLYFRKFTLAKSLKAKVEYHVPLRLALGILSDKDGIIDLKAPVESKGKDVKVKYLGKIILKIIGNLFIKAAVSPFKLFSSAYNVDPASLQDIRLELMDPAPSEKYLKSVDIIADILNKKPALNIDFYYCADKKKAVDSLAYLLTIDDYLKNNNSSGTAARNIPDSLLIGFLHTKLSAEVIKIDSGIRGLCRNYIGTKQVETKLDSVKSMQINFITNYLSHDKGISAGRFRIIPLAPDTIKPAGYYPSFRTYFTEGEENQQ